MNQQMDEMDLLTRMRAEVQPDPAALLRARRRLLRHALAPALRRRRRRVVLAVGGVAAAGVLAAGALFVAPGPQGPEPAAAAVLERAAAVAHGEPTPRPGQYVYVRETHTEHEGGRATTSVQEFWVPGDLRGDEVFLDSDGSRYVDPVDAPAIWTDPSAGHDELLAWLERPNGDLRGDAAAWERMGETLADAAAPEPFKAALLDAATGIDGVRVVDRSVDFHGHDAVVIGRDGEALRTEFVFDRVSGAYLGMIGNGVGIWTTTLTATRVVDSLPVRARD